MRNRSDFQGAFSNRIHVNEFKGGFLTIEYTSYTFCRSEMGRVKCLCEILNRVVASRNMPHASTSIQRGKEVRHFWIPTIKSSVFFKHCLWITFLFFFHHFPVGDVQTVHIQPRLVRRSPTDFTPSASPATPLTPKSPGTPGFFDDLGTLDPSLYTMVAEVSHFVTPPSPSPLLLPNFSWESFLLIS